MKPEIQKLLVEGIMKGTVYFVGEYRGSHIGERSFVDKADGKKRSFIGATHLLEVNRDGKVEAIKLVQRVPDTVTDPKDVLVNWKRGETYAFPISRMNWKNGTIEIGLADGEVIPL